MRSCRVIVLVTSLITFGRCFAADGEAAREVQALEERARTLLKSDDERQQAWGAWLVASHRLAGVGPTVRDMLDTRLQERGGETDERWLAALTDALIQTRTAATPATQALLLKQHHDVLFLLLAEIDTPSSEAGLRQLALQSSFPECAAATNLFVGQSVERFVCWSFPACPLKLQVTILDPDGRAIGVLRGGGRFDNSSPVAGRPPRVAYELLIEDVRRGDVVLAPGVIAVLYRREVGPRRATPLTSYSRSAAGYILATLRAHARLADNEGPVSTTVPLSLSAAEVGAIMEQIRDAGDELRVQWETLRAALVLQKALPDENAALPQLLIEVCDFRREKTPIPELKYDMNAKAVVRPGGTVESINAPVIREIRQLLANAHDEYCENQKMKDVPGHIALLPRREAMIPLLFSEDTKTHRQRMDELNVLLRNDNLPESSLFGGLLAGMKKYLQEAAADPERHRPSNVRWHSRAVGFLERLLNHRKVSRREWNEVNEPPDWP